MALSKDNVEKAWKILNNINPLAKNSFIEEVVKLDDENSFKTDTILGYDPKSDGGWENIFMNVKNITPEQLEKFEQRKREVHNSSFNKDEGNGITCIGWF